jgi:hypothetical protein
MTNPLSRILSAFLGMCLLVLSGCQSSSRTSFFRENAPPRDGVVLPVDFWEKVEEAKTRTERPDRRLGSTDTRIWLLPFNINTRSVSIGDDGSGMDVVHVTWNDIGVPVLLFTLPWRVKFRQYHYEEGSLHPTGFRSLTWSPFVFEDRAIGSVDKRLRIKGSGLPLLYSNLKVDLKDRAENDIVKLRGSTSLMTLGPSYMTIEQRVPHDKETSGTQSVYMAAPLFLGGWPGLMLWSDYRIAAKPTGDRFTGHGPLFGLLGYFAAKRGGGYFIMSPENPRTEEDSEFQYEVFKRDSESVRLLLMGLLWHDYSRRDFETGQVNSSRHGPLWSAFGWGRKNGRFKVRFLWIPIG